MAIAASLPSRLPDRHSIEGRLRRPSKSWLLGPALLVAAGVGVGGALAPLKALLALALIVIAACIWKWPALGAYLVIGLTPLIAGINRGAALPILRPNEAIAVLVASVLATRGIVQLRTGHLPKLRLDAVEISIVLLAVCSSVVPLWWMTIRQEPIIADDLTYSLVLWKYLGLYVLIRASVSTDRQIRRCLLISVGAACIVSVLAILQSLGLFGIPRLLATYYAPFGYDDAWRARGSSTLGLPAAAADLLLYNLAIVSGLWLRARRQRALLVPIAALLVLGTLSSGEFSSAIGLVVAVASIALVTNSARLLAIFSPAGLIASVLLQPVLANRFSGFQSGTGLPVSWTGRLHNLQGYFWPRLFSDWNFLLGLRPAARVPVSSQGTGYVWIESGYTWLLWGGGIPLFASFVFFVVVTAKRGWEAAHRYTGAAGVAGIALFVAIIVTTVLMLFDPHLTYRGAADVMFALIALAAPRRNSSLRCEKGCVRNSSLRCEKGCVRNSSLRCEKGCVKEVRT
jgi:hypothetical protein